MISGTPTNKSVLKTSASEVLFSHGIRGISAIAQLKEVFEA